MGGNTEGKSNQLIGALLDLQQAISFVVFDSYNPHYKSHFASLNAIWKMLKPLLKSHGFVMVQNVATINGNPSINTILMHKEFGSIESGWLELILDKDNMQGVGSAVTYSQRYQLCALLGILDADKDDDGNAASVKDEPRDVSPPKPQASKPRNVLKPLKDLQVLVGKRGINPNFATRAIKALFNKNTSADLTEDEINELIRFLSGDLADIESFIINLEQGDGR